MFELFRNRLGSILTAVALSTGTVAADYDYDSFGQRELLAGSVEQRYGYTGREHDVETGLIYYRARHYDPALGQFLQRDPIGFAAGDLNLYAYVWNDPHNWTDPAGLSAQSRNAALLGTGFAGIAGIALLAVQNLGSEISAAIGNIDVSGSSSGPDATPGSGNPPGDRADPVPPPPSGNECASLVAKMDSIIEELRTRFKQWRRDKGRLVPGEPPVSRRKGNFPGHVQQIWNKQQQLQTISKQADAKGCQYNRTEVYYWIHRPVPFPGGIGSQ
ncbi:RHS repeat-associated core domain-containing protein [Parasulfitobacter algicola]|uniref:RHS repeat-associated core domain-containing protein n=1 Tax=Parasulfitobacter algicola TaxID=2614809 RepID=UPI001C2CE8C2